MKRETLLLEDETTDQAWPILDELAGLYGDNGGDPDGNAWLPSEPITADEAKAVIAAGLGEMVNPVSYLDDDEIAALLNIEDVLELADHCDDWEAFQHAVEGKTDLWAHYGAYGAGDSRWVIVLKRKPTFIRVEFSDDGLYGSTDPDEERIDTVASAQQFQAQLTQALAAEYPNSRISIAHTQNDRSEVDGYTDHDEGPWIDQIIHNVWSAWDWIVQIK